MKIVRIRRGVLFWFFLLTPILQFYISPYIPIKAALVGGIAISIFVFLSLFVVGIFFGRAPCGWIMPCGGFQETCFYINDKKIFAGKKDRIKYVIWALWFTALLVILLSQIGKLHIDLWFALDHGISVSQPLYYIPYYLVLIILFSLCMGLGKRALCHYGCWIAPFMIFGRKLGNTLRLPGLRLKADQLKCTDCQTCNKVCPMGIDVSSLVKSGKMEHSECILCAECSNACPAQVMRFTFTRYECNRS
ncbi:4Fe-4S ferredoxin iron-sulfur binding domain protein [Candidatus Vecturithrix granuli]|uniref:4Fe-4S ferredoxin iron-sulfur binding domain protein n=1 Tax=Vecturithrix granuli TaxID=1499967 RepID=A0A081BTQ8_VECG1|nr:4Fe-4S ferredoxin iron-sulfur binding domain protein [Candidatus Vecturithrix granuli]